MDTGQGSSWIPATPGKPDFAKSPPTCSNREENQQTQVDWLDLQGKQALGHATGSTVKAQNAAAYSSSTSSVTVDQCFISSEAAVGTKYGGGINMYNNFPSDNVDMWNNVSFGDLLAMAHAGGSGTTPADEIAFCVKSSFQPPINTPNADERSNFSSFPFKMNSPSRMTGATSSCNISFQFEPVTPDLIKIKAQGSNESNLDINVTSAARITQSNEDIIKRAEANELQQIQSELTLNQSELQEYQPDKEGKQVTQLNNTPERKPRRRKHRPKVVAEDKPKRTPKPRTKKQPGSEETKTEKRKYVRRNKVGEPAATFAEEVNSTICHEGKAPGSEKTPTAKRKYVRRNQATKSTGKPSEEGSSGTIGRPAATSAEEINNTIFHNGKPPCSEETPIRKRNVRRNQANKSMEKLSEEGSSGTIDPTEVPRSRKTCRKSLSLEFESPASDENSSYKPSTMDLQANNSGSTSQSAESVQLGPGKEATSEETEVGITCNITRSLNQEVRNYLPQPAMQCPGPPTPDKAGWNHGKAMVGNHNESTRGNNRVIFSDLTLDKHASILRMTPQNLNCSNSSSSACLPHGKGLKRQHSCRTDEAQFYSINARGAYFNSMQAYQAILPAHKPDVYSNVGMHFSAIYKKMRAEKGHSSTSSYIRHFTGETNCVPSSQCNISGSPSNNSATSIGNNRMWNSNAMSAFVEAERLRRRSNSVTQAHDLASLHEIYKQFRTSTSKEATTYGFGERYKATHISSACMGAPIADTRAAMKTKRQSKKSILVSSAASDMYAHQHFTKNARGSLPALTWRGMSLIDEIAEHLQHLDLNRESSQNEGQHGIITDHTKFQRESALVLYQRDGSMVPFGSSLARKRKPRPKVDVDDETDRVWKLLLQDINSEGIDGTDEDKAKWWEDERRVFNSRADSFIARMRLVQGDRRFSPWKGSVVDSVVGVYLTQNVSDHLSSSAFMSLAAHFPLKTDSTQKHEGNTGIIIEEPEECATDPNVSIRWYEDQPNQSTHCQDSSGVYSTDSNEEKAVVNDSESSENSTQCIKSAECSVILQSDSSREGSDLYHGSTVTGSQDPKELNDLPSSSSSVVSSENSAVIQASEGTDSSNFCSSTSFLKLLQMAGTSEARGTSCPEHLQEGENLPFLGKELSGPEKSELSAESAHSALSAVNPQNKLDIETVNDAVVNVEVQFQNEDSNCNVQQVAEGPTFSETIADVTERANIVFDSCKSEQRGLESNLKNDTNHVCSKVDKVNDSPSKAKNGRPGKEKENIDWDSLRLQAQANGKKRERTRNTMDSLDYEAVRCANVDEIAHTIRERGMNNKLAERIKAFLNRIVSDHGSIDLEWLRDVPPDKAKEYLLSIRGLGLKSVECVRLLTLHHLAFPVDVNVGRIAVRLGWVPLQPLPESLQLHLLELYPILESIQKYLWPRLCKLDQKTLYELHYHMITFGKVFCTKSKPNCNACPLRGECRHFASAFASARLALPAPEEKSIVSATEDKAANNNPRENFSHLPLQLPPGNEQPVEHQKLITSAPIIEVPATPQPIVEVPSTPEQEQIQAPEIDIEDTCLEDPSEIPMIELNMTEFTQNVKKYVENNMELRQVEMSNALVALTSEAASIPTPKLKNVSRLRTEHQVYELPDSHPLLEGMDKREPDDPSSYLLAIWTPGETANSTQPPETQCNSQESGTLCEDETCSSCNSIREAHSQTVRGTLLIPCRTAMRGSFPLNGTYFQVNEVFADHDSSLNPINVPRDWLWSLPRRTVYFGTSIPTIFKGLNTESIQHCFWRGFVCVRGFDHKTRAPRPLLARFHFPASKLNRTNGKTNEDKGVAS